MTDKDNILFINRDKILLEDLSRALGERGYSVHIAFDMRSALSALSANSMKLIICDNTLQDVTGYDLLRFLKNDPLREKIPFIFMVPINDQGRAMNAFKLGAFDYVVYPITTDELVVRMGEAANLTKAAETVFNKQLSVSPAVLSSSPGNTMESTDEKRRTSRHPLSHLRIDVSRNGVFWLPAQIKNINREGMFLETSLLAKAGVELFVKIALPSGTCIIKGLVKHLAFKNNNPSAGIGVEIEKNTQWKEVLQYIIAVIKKGDAPSNGSAVSSPQRAVQQALPASPEETRIVARTVAPAPRVKVNASYEVRFYQSLVGKQLDNYKAVSFIGSGAMGGVFEGWDIALERTVALKVISYKLAAKEKSREMFIKEARLASKLDHPNIAHMYHIGNVNEILYFAMEYIDGVTMSDMIKRGDKFNTLKGLNYLITICEALDFVGQNNIIHRDIKPANIMINEKGVLKVVDFGVAKILDVDGENNNKEGIVGSPYYISPEAIDGSPLDLRSDIYSLGASFYHAFTGAPPFDGLNAEEVLRKHLEQAIIPLRKKNPKVSPALGKIVEKMMAKLPENRYQDYRSIIKDLKSLESKAQTFQKLKNATLIFRLKPRVEVTA